MINDSKWSIRGARIIVIALAAILVGALGVGLAVAQGGSGKGRVVATGVTAKPGLSTPTDSGATAAIVASSAATLPASATTVAPTTTSAPAHAPTTVTSIGSAHKPTPAARPSASSGDIVGPEIPGSVILPYQPGQHVWSAVSNGISMTLDMEPATPDAGQPVSITATATVPDGNVCCALSVAPFDETSMAWTPIPDNSTACAGSPLPTTATHDETFTFNKPGRIPISFEAGAMCSNGDLVGVFYGSVEIGPGPSTAQGPSLPVLTAGDGRLPSQMQDPTLAIADAWANDNDGYITTFTVDWGDGTPAQTFPGDNDACDELPDGWPAPSYGWIGARPDHVAPTHNYADPQPTVITVTVTSTGCDGTDPQQAVASFPWIPPLP